MVVLFVLLSGFCGACRQQDDTELVLFCAAGLRGPISKIAGQFQSETGVPVRLHFAGSGTLLSNLRVASGDLYLAADGSYIEQAIQHDLVSETFIVAQMTAGLGVRRGNPKQLATLTALIEQPEIRYGIGNPGTASIGRHTQKKLAAANVWELLEPNTMFPTVNELANAIELGSIDAAIIWDAVAHQYPGMDFVPLPEFADEQVDVTIAVTRNTRNHKAAVEFCRYLMDDKKGQVIFAQSGYAQAN